MADFWTRKIYTYFKRIDFDEDGVITQKDFVGMAEKFSAAGKLSADRSAQLLGSLTDVWKALVEEVGGAESITKESLAAAIKARVEDPKLRDTLKQPLFSFFEAVDANNDGFIDGDEFKEFYTILGAKCVESAPASFAAIDTNNDGKLSKDEFVTAGLDFLVSKDENCPSRLFWGPIEN